MFRVMRFSSHACVKKEKVLHNLVKGKGKSRIGVRCRGFIPRAGSPLSFLLSMATVFSFPLHVSKREGRGLRVYLFKVTKCHQPHSLSERRNSFPPPNAHLLISAFHSIAGLDWNGVVGNSSKNRSKIHYNAPTYSSSKIRASSGVSHLQCTSTVFLHELARVTPFVADLKNFLKC